VWAVLALDSVFCAWLRSMAGLGVKTDFTAQLLMFDRDVEDRETETPHHRPRLAGYWINRGRNQHLGWYQKELVALLDQ
jgi:hypothetical protein